MMTVFFSVLLLLSWLLIMSPAPRYKVIALWFNLALVLLLAVGLFAKLVISTLWVGLVTALIFLALSCCRFVPVTSYKWLGYCVRGLVSTPLLIIGLFFTLAFTDDVPEKNSGAYAVGLATQHLVDTSREEQATEDPNDSRELMLYLWYPAAKQPDYAPLPLFIDQQLSRFIASSTGLPEELFDYISEIPGNSYANATVAKDKRFPLLIFSHGFGSIATQNALLMEHLASHGYIVVSIAHPYQAGWVELPNHRGIAHDPAGFDSANVNEIDEGALFEQLQSISIANSDEAYMNKLKAFVEANEDLNASLDIWIEDTAFVVSQITGKPIEGLKALQAAIEPQQLGVFGMSYGGATAGMFCYYDSRCKAGINMDGLQYGEHNFNLPLSVPFMLINSDKSTEFEDLESGSVLPYEINDFVFKQAQAPMYSLTIGYSKHMNFSDLAYVFPAGKIIGLFGSVDIHRLNQINNDYVLAFFDQYLKQRQGALLSRPSPYPEVIEYIQRNTTEALTD